MTASPSEPPPTIDLDRESPQPKRSRVRIAMYTALAVAVVSAAALGLYLNRGTDPGPGTGEPEPNHGELAGHPPDTGEYAIRAAHSGLCLGTGPEIKDGEPRDKEVFTQQECLKRTPPTGLTALDNGLYRLTVEHPRQGPGCGQVDGEKADGAGEWLVTPRTCGDDERQFFRLERDGDAYLIKTNPDPSQCLGILEGSTQPGVQIVTGACGRPAQKWYVEKP